MALSGKRILLIISGGIAAYKSLDLIRRLRECGGDWLPPQLARLGMAIAIVMRRLPE